MKILSWNVRGLGSEKKRMVVKDVICSNKVHVVMIQESKLKVMTDCISKEIWGSRYLKWQAIDSVGSAGGIILMWDTRKVHLLDSWGGEFSISALIREVEKSHRWMITSVYGSVQN